MGTNSKFYVKTSDFQSENVEHKSSLTLGFSITVVRKILALGLWGSIPSIPTTASYQRHGCGVFRKIASSKATTGTNERNSQRNEGVVASRDLKH